MIWDSRILESEADYIGMYLMAKAGYDIRQIIHVMKVEKELDQRALKAGRHGVPVRNWKGEVTHYMDLPVLFDTHPRVSVLVPLLSTC